MAKYTQVSLFQASIDEYFKKIKFWAQKYAGLEIALFSYICVLIGLHNKVKINPNKLKFLYEAFLLRRVTLLNEIFFWELFYADCTL